MSNTRITDQAVRAAFDKLNREGRAINREVSDPEAAAIVNAAVDWYTSGRTAIKTDDLMKAIEKHLGYVVDQFGKKRPL